MIPCITRSRAWLSVLLFVALHAARAGAGAAANGEYQARRAALRAQIDGPLVIFGFNDKERFVRRW